MSDKDCKTTMLTDGFIHLETQDMSASTLQSPELPAMPNKGSDQICKENALTDSSLQKSETVIQSASIPKRSETPTTSACSSQRHETPVASHAFPTTTPVKRPLSTEETHISSLDSPSPTKQRKTLQDAIDGLEAFSHNLDLNLRAALYSLSEGETQQVKETLMAIRRNSKCALQQSLFLMRDATKMNSTNQQKMATMQKYNSHLVRERNDFQRRLKLAKEKNNELEKKVMEKIFSDSSFQEDDDTTNVKEKDNN